MLVRIAPAFLIVSAACASTPPHVSSGPGEMHRAAPQINTPTHAILLPAVGRMSVVADHDGARDYLFGSLRLHLAAHDGSLGEGRFAAQITAATPTAAGWVFVADDGTVAGAESFLGPLHRLGQTGLFAPQGARASNGRAVIADGNGTLWSTDGREPLAVVASLSSAHVDSAAFMDALHGAAVTHEGALWFTTDGGANWRPVALDTATATSVSFGNGQLIVETSAGSRALDANGALANAGVAPAAARPVPGDASRALDTALQSFPDLLPNFEAVTRSDGVSVLIDRDALVLFDRATGRLLRRATGLPLRGCTLSPWGSEIAIYCAAANDNEDPRAYRWNETEAIPLGVPWNARDALFSDDALHAVRGHACRADHGSAASMCVLRDGRGDWHTVNATQPIDRLLAMHGASVLARTPDRHIVLIDSDSGATTGLQIRSDRTDLNAVMMTFTRDGGFAGSAADADGSRYALLGTNITSLHAMPFPEGAVVCGFLDQQHGAAAGRNASRVWRTTDGAAHWERLDLGIDGAASDVPLLTRPEDVYGAISCNDAGCQIGRAAAIRGWGPAAVATRDVLGPIEAPPPPEAPAPSAPPSNPPPAASSAPAHRGHHHHHHHHAH